MARRTWKFTVTTFYRLLFALAILTGLAWAVEIWQAVSRR